MIDLLLKLLGVRNSKAHKMYKAVVSSGGGDDEVRQTKPFRQYLIVDVPEFAKQQAMIHRMPVKQYLESFLVESLYDKFIKENVQWTKTTRTDSYKTPKLYN